MLRLERKKIQLKMTAWAFAILWFLECGRGLTILLSNSPPAENTWNQISAPHWSLVAFGGLVPFPGVPFLFVSLKQVEYEATPADSSSGFFASCSQWFLFRFILTCPFLFVCFLFSSGNKFYSMLKLLTIRTSMCDFNRGALSPSRIQN